jgi:excisionase family DNA binding protein
MSKNPHPSPKFLSTSAAARRLGVCSRTLRNWAASGKLTSHKINARCTRWDIDELDALMASHAVRRQ